MLIGRNYERQQLLNLCYKEESQFCAVYGRRRVGKTFLIRETFNNQFAFTHTGSYGLPREEQLDEFRLSLKKYGLKTSTLKNWRMAFHALEDLLESSPEKGKKIVFIDELSWMDTTKSMFISALENFWNAWASARKDIVLIICGSATSWIINKIINNHGGLHNRVTMQIYLRPFTLGECEQFVSGNNIAMSRQEIAEGYMALGGIPFYWTFLQNGLSMSQNIDKMFFEENSPLKNEFNSMFSSLFENESPHLAVIEALCGKKAGLTRSEILAASGLYDNATFNNVLSELEQCTFIRKFYAFRKKTKDVLYQLIDNFTLFYYHYIKQNSTHDNAFYTHSANTKNRISWQGLAFERLCLWHIPQIKKKLGISGIISSVNSWRVSANEEHEGAQIDLLIDRNDKVINICEMKYSDCAFALTAKNYEDLRRKVSVFNTVTNNRKTIHLTMITSFGITHNAYANQIQSQVTLDDLFLEP